MEPVTALIYARVSQDSQGLARSVTEQETECRAECARRGWVVASVVTENDRSASKYAKRTRPEWERVKRELANGGVGVLVTWEASRSGRDLAEYVRLRDLCVSANVLLSYSGRVLDLSTSTDAFLGGLDALLAERESGQSSERIRRSTRAAAAAGRPHGRRTYGYTRVYDVASGRMIGQEPNPPEAAIVVEIVTRVATGDALRGIANDLTDRGERTAAGAEWSATTVRRVARNLAYAGIRVHGTDEHPATWQPIVSEQLLRQARARTDANVLCRQMPDSSAVHLLSGLLRCGICGEKMWRQHDRNQIHTYNCRTRGYVDPVTGKKYGIGHCTVRKHHADDLVIDVVGAYLKRGDVAAQIATAAAGMGTPSADEASVLRLRLAEAVNAYSAGTLSVSTLAKVEADLLPKIAAAEQLQARRVLSPVVADALGTDFASLPMGTKREILRALVTITIAPTGRGTSWKPSRISFDWKV